MRHHLLHLVTAIILVAAVSGGVALAASEADPVRYSMLTLAEPGGRVLFYFEVKNVGATAWAPGSVTLSNVSSPMGAATQHGLSRNVFPNETAYWDFEATAPNLPGVHESRWEIRRGGAAISPRLTCYVIAVPKEAQALRAKIQKLIDDFNQEHGHEVEQVVRMIRDLIQREGGSLIERLIDSRCGILPGMLALLAVGLAVKRDGGG